MRTTAIDVQPTDRVRGLGLTVEYNEPETDNTRRLTGTVSVRSEDGDYEYHTSVTVPNEHVVNVVRTDEAFLTDAVEQLGRLRAGLTSGDLTEGEALVGVIELVRADRRADVPFYVDTIQPGDVAAGGIMLYLSDPELDIRVAYDVIVRGADGVLDRYIDKA